MTTDAFRPALIVVDLQEDFCPAPEGSPDEITDGSLAVAGGRDTAPVINTLLSYGAFVTRIATQDWHPPNHVSFADETRHPGKKAFVDTIIIVNPENPGETYETQLWPRHCVQGTKGAELIPELDRARVDEFVLKGKHPDIEMYSAFCDPLVNPRVCDSGLAKTLKAKGITHVYVVGLAFDFCVKNSALDAAKEGFATLIVEEGTRAVFPDKWAGCRKELESGGVRVVSVAGPEVARLKTGAT